MRDVYLDILDLSSLAAFWTLTLPAIVNRDSLRSLEAELDRLPLPPISPGPHRHALFLSERQLQPLNTVEPGVIPRAPARRGRTHPVIPLARKPLRKQHTARYRE